MSVVMNAGDRNPFFLEAGAWFTASGACEVLVDRGPTKIRQKIGATEQQVGPFLSDAQILIIATAETTYTVHSAEAWVPASLVPGQIADLSGLTVADYSALRASTSSATQIEVTDLTYGATYLYDSTDTTSAEALPYIVVRADGRRYKLSPSSAFPLQASGSDDTAALTAAFVRSKTVVLKRSSVAHQFASAPTLPDGATLYVENDVTFSGSTAWLSINGTAGSAYAVSGDTASGNVIPIATSVSGLAADDYLSVTDPVTLFGAMYRIKSIASLNVTIDRQLDFAITAANTVVTRVATTKTVAVIGDGRSKVTMTSNYPKLFSGSYLLNPLITGLTVECTGTAASSDAANSYLVGINYCFNPKTVNNTFYGLTGGVNFGVVRVFYSSFVQTNGNTLRDITGSCTGLDALYSTHVEHNRNRLSNVAGGDVGAIFAYFCNYSEADGNTVYGTRYDATNSTYGSGVQVTGGAHAKVRNNTLSEIVGPGGVYIGTVANPVTDVQISGNHIDQSVVQTNNHLSAIHIRGAFDVSITDNGMYYTTVEPLIWLRGVDGFLVSGNKGKTAGGQPILLDKAGSDALSAEYFPKNGKFSGNEIHADTAATSVNFISTGSLCDSIAITENKFRLDSSDGTAATNKWGALLSGTNITFSNNESALNFTAGGNNYYIQMTGTTDGIYSDNVVYDTNASGAAITTPTGWSGARNWYPNYVTAPAIVGISGTAARLWSVVADQALRYGATGSRPTLTTLDAGFMYYDTTTTGIVTWTGSTWV